MDAAAAMAITIIAVVDIGDARTAHRMIADNQADVIAFTGVLPTVRRLSLPGRTVPLPRDGEPLALRRPQLVGERTQPIDRSAKSDTTSADRRESQPQRSDSALEPPVRRRASDRSLRRRRRT
ncbi:MAG TPA: hypothetical protein VGJ44_17785 [Kribbellaceae bacterium]